MRHSGGDWAATVDHTPLTGSRRRGHRAFLLLGSFRRGEAIMNYVIYLVGLVVVVGVLLSLVGL